MDSVRFVVERFGESNDSLMRKLDLEERLGLVLDEVLDLTVHVRVGIASRQAPEYDRVDWCCLKQVLKV